MVKKQSLYDGKWASAIAQIETDLVVSEEASLFLGEAVTEEQISKFEDSLGVTLPSDFKSLYTEVNGIGSEEKGEIMWFFVPLQNLTSFKEEAIDWFHESHPDLANRFLPFISWGNGDYSGYLILDDSTISSQIYIFEHESYEFEAQQDSAEFMLAESESIKTFLSP